MTVDYTKVQRLSSTSSNKVLLQGSSSFNVIALSGAGEATATATIPHLFGSDNLLWQVAVNSTTVGALIDEVVLPWSSSDNRLIAYASVDSTNLYITVISSDSSGLGAPAFTVNYAYRILVP